MLSRASLRALKRRKADGTYVPAKDPTNAAYRPPSDEEQRAQTLADRRAILADERTLLPSGLTTEALKSSELAPEDWALAESDLFAAKPDMKLTMLRVIFLRGLDPFHSFDMVHWQTRASLLAARIGRRESPSHQAYIDAVEESQQTPGNFAARERYVAMWHAGQASLTKWPRGVHTRLNNLKQWAYLQQIAIQTLEFMAEQEGEEIGTSGWRMCHGWMRRSRG